MAGDLVASIVGVHIHAGISLFLVSRNSSWLCLSALWKHLFSLLAVRGALDRLLT